MPNLIPDWFPWMQPLGRMIWALLATAIGLGVVFALLRRPKSDRPATWAQCMLGAVGTFGLFFLCYAIVPHEWLTFADGYLNWSTDKFVFKHNQWGGWSPADRLPVQRVEGHRSRPGSTSCSSGSTSSSSQVAEAAHGRGGRRGVGEQKVVRTSRFGRPVKAKA